MEFKADIFNSEGLKSIDFRVQSKTDSTDHNLIRDLKKMVTELKSDVAKTSRTRGAQG